MSSPVRSVVVRLAMDPSSYVAGAAKAEKSTLSLDAATAKVGPHAATSMEQAAAGAGKAEGALGKLNKSAGALGVTLGGLAGVGGAVAVGMSVKWAADYQQALTNLVTTAGESPKALAAVSKGMLDMAGQVGISAQELAQGMYTVDSANIHGADSLIVLKAAAQGAKQENADLSHVVDAVTTALHDYNLPASDAAKVTSQLITAVSHGKTSFDELTGAMHSVTPLAAALHVPLADIAGTLSAMTASGESADQAAQNMADALRHMQNPTSTMTAELAQLGINSAELGPMLGQKGLAGTIQTIASAIVNHLDPATKQVLLPALNKSKTAAQDLQIMLGQMPPTLAKMSKGLLDGSVSILDYQKAAKGLSGQQGAMGLQFLSLVKSSQGFSNILKSGAPAAQTYTAALQKAMGTSAGLTVALQVTGEHAAATNAAIKDIATSAGDAKGNIKGWDEVQGTFNQQLAQAEQGIRSLAIETGQHLLPALTDVFRWIASDGVPGVQHLASGVGVLVHGFQELPAPVKDAALALAALKVASSIGFLSSAGTAVIGAVGKAVKTTTASVTSLSGEMTLQQALFAAEARDAELAATGLGNLARSLGATAASGAAADASLSAVQRQLFGYDAALAATVIEQDAANAGLSRMGAGGAVLAARGLSSLKSAGAGLLNMLGGPWMVGIAAAAGVLSLFNKQAQDHDKAVQAATADVTKWYKAMSSTGGKAAIDGMNNLRSKNLDLAKSQAELNKLEKEIPVDRGRAAGQTTALNTQTSALALHIKDLSKELKDGKQANDDYWNSLTTQGKLAATVAADEETLAYAIQQHGVNSREAKNATFDYMAALAKQKGLTDEVNASEQTQIEKLQQVQDVQLGAVSSALAATQAQSQYADAVAQYSKDAKDGQHSTKQLADESNNLAQQAIGVAQAIGKQEHDTLAATHQTDDGTVANRLMLQSLKDAAAHITGPGHDALVKAYNDLLKASMASDTMKDSATKMGLNVVKTFDNNTVVIKDATAAQIKDLQALGDKVTHLPDGNVVVTSDTGMARRTLDALINDYNNRTVRIMTTVGQHISSATGPGGTQLANARGNLVHAYAGGGIEPMSAGVAAIVPPNTLRIIGDRVVDDEAYIPINGSARSQQILGATAARMGFGLTREQPAPTRTRELAGVGAGGGGAAAIDYRQLAAALAAAVPDRPTVHVDRWDSTHGQSPYENAEALAHISRTRTW